MAQVMWFSNGFKVLSRVKVTKHLFSSPSSRNVTSGTFEFQGGCRCTVAQPLSGTPSSGVAALRSPRSARLGESPLRCCKRQGERPERVLDRRIK